MTPHFAMWRSGLVRDTCASIGTVFTRIRRFALMDQWQLSSSVVAARPAKMLRRALSGKFGEAALRRRRMLDRRLRAEFDDDTLDRRKGRQAAGRASGERICSDVPTAPDRQAAVHIPPASFERTHARMKRIPASPSSAVANARVDAKPFPSIRSAASAYRVANASR